MLYGRLHLQPYIMIKIINILLMYIFYFKLKLNVFALYYALGVHCTSFEYSTNVFTNEIASIDMFKDIILEFYMSIQL